MAKHWVIWLPALLALNIIGAVFLAIYKAPPPAVINNIMCQYSDGTQGKYEDVSNVTHIAPGQWALTTSNGIRMEMDAYCVLMIHQRGIR